MKRPILKLSAIAFIMSCGFGMSAQAQTADRLNIVSTAVPFLRISPDARAGGMGDVGIATLPDENAPFWNLAKTPFNTKNFGLGLTYTPWLKDLGLNDVYLASLAGFYKLDEEQAISTSIRFFSLGDMQFTNDGQNITGAANPREFSMDLGYSRKLSERMGLAVALRYINSNLVTGDFNGTSYKAGSSVAGDLSWYYNLADENGQGLALGAAISNLGSKISYVSNADQKDYIPANLGIGAAYTKVFNEDNKITFALDINKLMVPTPPQLQELQGNPGDPAYDEALANNQAKMNDYRSKSVVSSWLSSFGDADGGFSEELKEFMLGAGAEYWYNDQFALRAGYFYENKDKGNRRYFTVGTGIRYNIFTLNFSYLVPTGSGVTRNPLSNTLRFGLAFDLSGGNE